MASRNRNWIFTLNNPGPEFRLDLESGIKYYIYQLERGENGTEHIQGYVCMASVKTLQQMKNLIPRAHWEKRKGTHAQARDYCQKEESRIGLPVTAGVEPQKGKRSDLVEGVRLLQEGATLDELVNAIGNSAIRYKRHLYETVQEIEQQVSKKRIKLEYEQCQLRDWQQNLFDKLCEEPDPRTVYWVHDSVGNKGKTWFAKYLYHVSGAAVYGNNKSADVKFAYNGERIVIFDLCRSTEDRVNYEVIESIKNGMFFNSKYISQTKSYKTPHVVVLSNFEPDKSKLSEDRWKIIHLINFI